MKKFQCPFCKNETTRIYSKDRKYFVNTGVILRYRRCECCGKKFITKDDTKNETLFRTIEKRTIDLLKEAK